MTAAVKCDLPFVNEYADRHGKLRRYFRRKGHRTVPLPGEPGSKEFIGAYQAALEEEHPRVAPSRVYEPGSFGALCTEYLESADFKTLIAESTRRERRYVIDKLREKHADKRVAMLKRRHILIWRDRMQATPGAANTMIRTVKLLLSFAFDRSYRDDNPALKIRLLKVGRFRAWTDEERAQFEARWPAGTLQRTIYALALYTGQRREVVAKMRWSDIAGPAIKYTPNKQRVTDAPRALTIPLHRELKATLTAAQRSGETIVADDQGHAYNPIYVGSSNTICRAAGIIGCSDAISAILQERPKRRRTNNRNPTRRNAPGLKARGCTSLTPHSPPPAAPS